MLAPSPLLLFVIPHVIYRKDVGEVGRQRRNLIRSAAEQRDDLEERTLPVVIDIPFRDMKAGGFKLWLFFHLLAEGKVAKEQKWIVRETLDGLRVIFINEEADEQKNEAGGGCLDVYLTDTKKEKSMKICRLEPNRGLSEVLNRRTK